MTISFKQSFRHDENRKRETEISEQVTGDNVRQTNARKSS